MFSLNELISSTLNKRKSKIAIVSAEDKHVMEAVKIAVFENLICPIFIGDRKKIIDIAAELSFNISEFEVIDNNNFKDAATLGVHLITTKQANILMKGLVPTSILMKAVLNRTSGLGKSNLLSHVSINQVGTYPKVLIVTDAAMNIKPSITDKVEIINNAVAVCHKLGISNPNVAVICPIEFVNPKIESTVHASILTEMSKNGLILNCNVYGPLALDNAISKEAAELKGIKNNVAGNADILLCNDLDSGNILYKSINFLANGSSAAIITGTEAPIVLTSRSDSTQTKLYSIALACCVV
jgi:phosphate butyryltransferase